MRRTSATVACRAASWADDVLALRSVLGSEGRMAGDPANGGPRGCEGGGGGGGCCGCCAG